MYPGRAVFQSLTRGIEEFAAYQAAEEAQRRAYSEKTKAAQRKAVSTRKANGVARIKAGKK